MYVHSPSFLAHVAYGIRRRKKTQVRWKAKPTYTRPFFLPFTFGLVSLLKVLVGCVGLRALFMAQRAFNGGSGKLMTLVRKPCLCFLSQSRLSERPRLVVHEGARKRRCAIPRGRVVSLERASISEQGRSRSWASWPVTWCCSQRKRASEQRRAFD